VRAGLNVKAGEGGVVEVQASNQVQLIPYSNHYTQFNACYKALPRFGLLPNIYSIGNNIQWCKY
jgi:hypothetical protein